LLQAHANQHKLLFVAEASLHGVKPVMLSPLHDRQQHDLSRAGVQMPALRSANEPVSFSKQLRQCSNANTTSSWVWRSPTLCPSAKLPSPAESNVSTYCIHRIR
jgi:hypothetical protein